MIIQVYESRRNYDFISFRYRINTNDNFEEMRIDKCSPLGKLYLKGKNGKERVIHELKLNILKNLELDIRTVM